MTTHDHIRFAQPYPALVENDPIRTRRQSLRWTIPLLIVIALVAIVQLPRIFSRAGQSSPAVGKPAPQLDLVRLDNQPRMEHFHNVPKGSIALIHFWGTWCPPCRMEFPELAAMAERHHDSSSSFWFVPVSCEAHSGETFHGLLSKTEQYLASEAIDVPCFADPRGVTRRSIAQRLESSSMVYPTSVLIDADGNIAGVWEGYTPSSVRQMEALINRLLPRAMDPKVPS